MLVIGPVIAKDHRSADGLIDYIAQSHQGLMRIDIPAEHTEVVKSLVSRGFSFVNRPPIMLYNRNTLPSRCNADSSDRNQTGLCYKQFNSIPYLTRFKQLV
jgi:hypothetical protein